MFCREVIAVCSKNHAKHVNSVCGQNAKFLSIKPGGRVQLKRDGIW